MEAPSEGVSLVSPVPVVLPAGARVEIRWSPSASKATWSLLKEACAAEEFTELHLPVLAGEALVRGTRIQTGQRVRIPLASQAPLASEPIREEDLDRIERWRAQRIGSKVSWSCAAKEIVARHPEAARLQGEVAVLEASPQETVFVSLPRTAFPAVFWAEVRAVGGHLVLRYPMLGGTGETLLGDLAAWKVEGWHRLAVRSGRSGGEVFLDGRSLLRLPPEAISLKARTEPALGVRGGSVQVRALGGGEDAL